MERDSSLIDKEAAWVQTALAFRGQMATDRMKGSRADLEREFSTLTRLLSIPGAPLPPAHRTGFLCAAYEPCREPLNSLSPIIIGDLRLEIHHRGRVLIVKTFTDPISVTSLQSAVEDEAGEFVRLAIFNLLPTAVPADILPRGAVVAIKDPYYKSTANGGVMVRVDHPTDFMVLSPCHAMIPPRLRDDPLTMPSAPVLKGQANTAFDTRQYDKALYLYTYALDMADTADMRRAVLRSRSNVHFALHHYEQSLRDALASVNPDPPQARADVQLAIKSLLRAGRAAYSMQDYARARQYFAQVRSLDPKHKGARAYDTRMQQRQDERETGYYDFTAMAQAAKQKQTLLDHASHISRTEVGLSPGRGRGLFATETIKAGSRVLVEKSLYTAHHDDKELLSFYNTDRHYISGGTQNLRAQGTLDRLTWSPTLARKYMNLFDGGQHDYRGPRVTIVDGRAVVDAFRVNSIAEINGFGCPSVNPENALQSDKTMKQFQGSTGIWAHASYANHSCIPNASRAFVGDMMIVHALQDIPIGQEIYMSYLSLADTFEDRREILLNGYAFVCDCQLCFAEAGDPPSIKEQRHRLGRELKCFVSANKITLNRCVALPATWIRATMLLDQIQDTYPDSRFRRLPRMQCAGIRMWLAMCEFGNRGEGERNCVNMCLEVFRDLGYLVTFSGSYVSVDRVAPAISYIAIYAAAYASKSLEMLGNKDSARAFEDLSKELYVTFCGVEAGFAEQFKKM